MKSLTIAVVVTTLIALLATSAMWRFVDQRSYDILSTFWPQQPVQPAAVIVAIDEPAMEAFGQQWPWPRSRHAGLIEQLRAAGARLIAFDVLFADPSADDDALSAAMGPDVVLAAEQTVIVTPHATQFMRIEPLPSLLQSGARAGYASVVLDDDGVLRRMPNGPDSFAAVIANTADLPFNAVDHVRFIQYFGPARTYPTVSYYQAIDYQTYLPAGFFKDRIVIVGLSLQNSATLGQADVFATPFTTRSGSALPGVEVQATILDNLVHDLHVRPLYWPLLVALTLLIAIVTVAVTGRHIRTLVLAALVLAGMIIIGTSWLMLQVGRLWVPPAMPLLALVLTFGIQSLRHYWFEATQRRAIQTAFSQYLSPDMVARLISDPSALELGGEERTITVLFSDVRGFTSLSERLRGDPMRLTMLLNRLLGPLSDIVMDQSGTIDKYIGDCLMAFWNAPLDDDRQADNALRAGLRMLNAVEALNRSFAIDGLPTVRIGVGINTGPCVVGNMGSYRRFNYSALGDAVNIAARLEGACKMYEVNIIIGQDTVAALQDPYVLIELDRLVVKGRTNDLTIYTALDESWRPVSAKQADFLRYYRDRRWDAALAALDEVDCAPLHGYRGVMQRRIEAYRLNPPPADWCGNHIADEK